MKAKYTVSPLTISTSLYLLKCIIGIIICYILYKEVPAYPFYWSMVSVVITISPDNSNKLAYDRIIANMLGCGVALCLYPIHVSSMIILCAGVAITIIAGTLLRITAVLRSALAALVIVIVTEESHREWLVALERVGCVVVGCTVALGLTLLFNVILKIFNKRFQKEESLAEVADTGGE